MEVALVLAALVAVLHGASIVYVVLGGFLGLRDPRWLVPHVATVAWIVVSGAVLAECPLTALEKWLITQGGGTPYEGYYIGHYLVGTFFPGVMEDPLRDLSAIVVVASWALVGQRRLAERRMPHHDRLNRQ
jgi:hypothetical protein